MSGRKLFNSGLILVDSRKSAAGVALREDHRRSYELRMLTGDTVPESGIYRVIHQGHRLPHEVTLRGQQFPRCSRCADRVVFQVIRTVPQLSELREAVILYELPAFDTDEGKSSVA